MKSKELYLATAFRTIVTVLIILLLTHPIAYLLDTIFVSTIFSKIENNTLNTAIIIILAVVTLIKFKNTKVFLKHWPLGIIIGVFYFGQRFNPYWNFYSIGTISNLYLWDLFIITIILAFLKDLLFKNKLEEEKVNKSFWQEDIPVNDSDHDTFKRRHYAKALAEQIIKMYSKKSFAIGILGEYGSGKSSFINLIKKNLDTNKIQVIEFNAWKSEKSENIQKDFFEHLANELSRNYSTLSTLITAYSRKLTGIDSTAENILKRIGFVNQLINNTETEKDEYERINEILKISDKKLVIVIDDMDRLYSSEVIEVLRLVRNTANFTNTFYLMAYEKTYIQNAIKEQLNVDDRSPFMDKIVQMEVPLPKMEQHNLLDLVKELLTKHISAKEMNDLEFTVFRYGFNKEYDHTFHDIFRNSRDVIKFINTFLLSYSLLKNEVQFEKLFLLELLKYRYPLFYERLYQHRTDFLIISDKKHNYLQYYELNKKFLERAKELFSFEYFLEKEGTHEDDIKLIRGLMMALFNDYSWSVSSTNSIVYPSNFERYFRFRLSASEISSFELKEAWKNGEQFMSEYVVKCAKQNLAKPLMNELFMITPTQKSEFELLLRSLFQLGSLYDKTKNERSFDMEALIRLMWIYKGMPSEIYYRGNITEYKNLLEQLFSKAKFPYTFHSKLILHLNCQSQKIPLEQHILIDHQIIYFCEYVHLKGLDTTAVDLMWNMRVLNPTSENNVKEYSFSDQAKPHILAFLKTNDLTAFIKSSIQKENSSKEFAIHPAFLKIFTSPNELYDYVKNNEKMKNETKLEYLEFFNQLAENNFTKFIEFEFKSELKPSINMN